MSQDDPIVHNITNYKLALEICKDFPTIINTIDETEKKLYNHIKYAAVKQILNVLYDNKAMLNIYLERYKKIKDSGGKVE